ncbi:hypothetical protein F5887DRAFT_1064882 [Amanita rubescens]|nr:hypothetical protein F5887DRAFT_1064882 [Amanita rubescens]
MFSSARFGALSIVASTALRVVALPSQAQYNAIPFSPGFDINQVLDQAQSLPSHSWEFGTASEALLELYNPSNSVFGDQPFPLPTLSQSGTPSLAYASTKIQIGAPQNVLANGDGSAGDPASLGVSAVLLGKTDQTMANAAARELQYILNDAPKYSNGFMNRVFSFRSDFIYMVPPFIAYYAAAMNDLGTLQTAVDQCWSNAQIGGAWTHIVGPEDSDPGLWSTGNAWAAAGMTRVLATVIKAPVAQSNGVWQGQAVAELSQYIQEILGAAMQAPTQDGLLSNYWNQDDFGEISGTSLLAYVAYRMAVLQPTGLSQQQVSDYVSWADQVRKTLGGTDSQGNPHVTSTGVVTPAVNPYDSLSSTPLTTGSPEGQSFVVLMYAAWRDCVLANICQQS